MTEPTPPPDEPLPDQARARIRADLLEAAQRPPSRSWVIPAAVAAAVVLVIGLAAWAVQAGRTTGEGAGPAAGASSTPAVTVTASPTTSPSSASSAPTATSTASTTTPAPTPTGAVQAGGGDCPQEAVNVLPDAELGAAFRDGTSMLVAGDRFVLCDVRDGVTTVQQPLPLSPSEGVVTYRVSSSNGVRVAGGVVPQGAGSFEVTYTFPDGTTAKADTVQGDGRTWWRVVHRYAAQGNELDDPPIEVTVRYSGVERHYTLRWGLDTCAQANHGC